MCPTCLTANVFKCTNQLVFAVGLDASIDILVFFETPIGKVYPIEASTDTDGNVTIDVADLPDGLLASYSNIKVTFALPTCYAPLPFTIEDVEYECVTLLMQDCDSIIDTQTIPCI